MTRTSWDLCFGEWKAAGGCGEFRSLIFFSEFTAVTMVACTLLVQGLLAARDLL